MMNMIPLVSWDNGIFMIGVFVVVVIVLIVAVISMVSSGSGSKENP